MTPRKNDSYDGIVVMTPEEYLRQVHLGNINYVAYGFQSFSVPTLEGFPVMIAKESIDSMKNLLRLFYHCSDFVNTHSSFIEKQAEEKQNGK